MNKKLVAVLLAGGLILGFPAAPKAAGNVSVPGSLHEVENAVCRRLEQNIIILIPKPVYAKRDFFLFQEKCITLPVVGMR